MSECKKLKIDLYETKKGRKCKKDCFDGLGYENKYCENFQEAKNKTGTVCGDGLMALACAMVQIAVEDHKMKIPEMPKVKTPENSNKRSRIKVLMEYQRTAREFLGSRALDNWIDSFDINTEAGKVRKALGIKLIS